MLQNNGTYFFFRIINISLIFARPLNIQTTFLLLFSVSKAPASNNYPDRVHINIRISKSIHCEPASFTIVTFVCCRLRCLFIKLHTAALRLIVRSWLDVPTFATRRLHACHHARAPSGGRWNCGREMSGNFAKNDGFHTI